MDYVDILYAKAAGVGTVTINRPEKHNALRISTFEELIDALQQAAVDEAVGVLVITGAGERAFCAGGDIKMAKVVSQTQHTMRVHHDRMLRISTLITQMAKPVLCALNGLSVGGGSEIALFSDLVIASDNASFHFNGTRIGGCSWWGPPQILPLMVGTRKAQEILLLGKPIGALEAYQIGLVNKVVPYDQLRAETDRWCQALLDLSPAGLQVTKASLGTTLNLMLGGLESTSELNVLATVGQQPRAAFEAFLAKRQIDWRAFRPAT